MKIETIFTLLLYKTLLFSTHLTEVLSVHVILSTTCNFRNTWTRIPFRHTFGFIEIISTRACITGHQKLTKHFCARIEVIASPSIRIVSLYLTIMNTMSMALIEHFIRCTSMHSLLSTFAPHIEHSIWRIFLPESLASWTFDGDALYIQIRCYAFLRI